MTNAATLNWLSRQTPAVREAWKEFPHLTPFRIGGKVYWVIGYEEMRQTVPLSSGGGFLTHVILSSIDPNQDFDAALADGPHKLHLTAAELRRTKK